MNTAVRRERVANVGLPYYQYGAVFLGVSGCGAGIWLLTHQPLYAAAALVLGALLILTCCLSRVLRLAGLACTLGLILGLYCTESALILLTDSDNPFEQQVRAAAKRSGTPYDPRAHLEMLVEARNNGNKAYPPFYPYLLLKKDGFLLDGLLPLGNHSKSRVIVCNEGGQYLTYDTDEFGFPNPKGIWTRGGLDAAIVGDSNAVGECVPGENSPAAMLRTVLPASVTLGAGGNGGLLELATIREYLSRAKPKHVLWIFSESHSDTYLAGESHSAFMRQYLDPHFSQHLIERQASVDDAVESWADAGLRNELRQHSLKAQAKQFATLTATRLLIYKWRQHLRPGKSLEAGDPQMLTQVLRQGQAEVRAWGGDVTLVYWPAVSRYPGSQFSASLYHADEERRQRTLSIAQHLGIPVIDLTPAFANDKADSKNNAIYFYDYPAHFTPEGYKRVGQVIATAMSGKR